LIRLFAHSDGARFAGLRSVPRGFAFAAAVAALSLPASHLLAQKQVPPAPAAPVPQAEQAPAQPAQQAAPGQAVPPAPAPSTAEPKFPPPNPKDFTAASPSKETVDSFLRASWGYDANRVWEVAGIMKTPVEGVSKVIIYVGEKGNPKPAVLEFFTMPDGKHIIAGNQIVAFGAHPYSDYRAQVQQRANGPFRGSASKNLEIVEFADFECPHCKDAQVDMDKLAADFPEARIVFQFYPLESIHPEAKKSAAYGYCVNKLGGSNAFQKFASAVFAGQQGLSTPDGATLTLNSSVVKAGLDPKKIGACAADPATSTDIEASVKLAQDLNIFETPMLVVNGREVPPTGVPYETLKKIIEYQAQMDGVPLQSASSATPPAPGASTK